MTTRGSTTMTTTRTEAANVIANAIKLTEFNGEGTVQRFYGNGQYALLTNGVSVKFPAYLKPEFCRHNLSTYPAVIVEDIYPR